MHKNARKKGRKVSQRQLFLAGWILMVTNVPQHWLSAEMVRPFYSLRWQIELLFKQLKSVLTIHKSNTSKENRFRCEVLGKLLMAIIIHRIHAYLNTMLWNDKQQEISMEKLYKRFQERAFILTDLLLISVRKSENYLWKEMKRMMKNCRKLNQRNRPSTLQSLMPVDLSIVTKKEMSHAA